MNKELAILFYFVFGVLGSIVTLNLSWISLTSPGSKNKSAILTLKSTDGATVWLGLFRSCAWTNSERFICTPFAFNPTYNFSVLGDGAPTAIIETPAPVLRGLGWLTTVLSVVLLPFTIWFVFRKECTGLNPPKDWELWTLLGLIGLETLACLVGALNFWFMELFYEKTGQHFNVFTNLLNRPELTASTGTSFRLAYVGYGMVAIIWCLTALDIHDIIEKKSKPKVEPAKAVPTPAKPAAPPPAAAPPAAASPAAPQPASDGIVQVLAQSMVQGANAAARLIMQPSSKSPNELPVPPPNTKVG